MDSVTSTGGLDFGSGPDAGPAHQCYPKRKLFSLAEVCTPPSAVVVSTCWHFVQLNTPKQGWTDDILGPQAKGVCVPPL